MRAVTAVTAALVTALAASVGGAGHGRDTLTSAASPTCSDVLLLAVPGDAETPVRGVTDSAGATLDVFAAAYRAAAAEGRRSVSVDVVHGRTARAAQLAGRSRRDGAAIDQVTRSGLRTWRAGLGATVRRLVDEVEANATTCPDQQLVLAGYAQGAMAVHRALLALRARPDVYDRITAAALVSDGYRLPGVPRRSLVGAPRARRAGRGVSTLFRTPPATLPEPGSHLRVWDVCTRGDLVCDITRARLSTALAASRSYTGGSRAALVAVGRRAFLRTSRWALPDRTDRAVTVQEGAPVDLQLGARVRSADRASVRWGDVVGLPPGLTLDDHGVLTGVASQTGVFPVTYTVQNTAAPEFERPATGGLTVTVHAAATPGPAVSSAISAGGTQSCQVRQDGTAWCWGDNAYGQLGDGSTRSSDVPVQVGSGHDWATISTSGSTTCATRTDGRAFCWGLDRWGQLGDGARTSSNRPKVVADPGPWRSVDAGWFDTCGVKVDGSAWCWGYNDVGQLGDGTQTTRLVPTRVSGGGTWSSIAVDGWHTCGVKQDGSAWCWGQNHFGELAMAAEVSRSTPQQVGTGTNWVQLAVSWAHTCGVKGNGTIWCWGKNDRGQLGDGTSQSRSQPVRVASDQTFVQVSLGDSHTCGTTTDGHVWCWGYNGYGQLGDGTTTDSAAPVEVPRTWQAMDAGWEHTCGVTATGVTRCWGQNVTGQLGNGTTSDSPTPTGTRTRG